MQTHEASSPVAQGHARRNFWWIYGALFLASALLFHLRFPLNFEVPNFYIEDGHIFADTLVEEGFFGALSRSSPRRRARSCSSTSAPA